MKPKVARRRRQSVSSGYDLGYDYCVDQLLFGSRP